MFLKQIMLSFLGFSAGVTIAAGIFAFLAIIGIFPRLLAVTGTKDHIVLCETMMIIGGIWFVAYGISEANFKPDKNSYYERK